MKRKNILLLLLMISLMFIGMIGTKADTWHNPQTIDDSCEMDTDGVHKKYYFYKYEGEVEESDNNIWINTCNGFKRSWLNGVGGADPSRAQIVYNQCMSDMNNQNNVVAVRVGGTCKYTITNQSTGEDQQAFCLQGEVELVEGGGYTYTPSGTTDVNKGISCGLVDAYKDSTIRSQLRWNSDGTLDIRSIPSDTVIAMQKKIWANQYDENKHCESSLDPNYAIVEFTDKNGSVNISASSDKLIYSNGYYVSKGITVTGSDIENNGNILVTLGTDAPQGTILSTSSTDPSKVVSNSGVANGTTVYLFVPSDKVTSSTSITVKAKASVLKKVNHKLQASFQKLESNVINNEQSQGLGLPQLKKIEESIYENEEKSVTLTVTLGSITISKQDVAGEKEIAGAKICIYVYDKDSKKKGDEVECFVSKDKPYDFYLNPGTYILEEELAPEGYEKIETGFVFTIDDNMKIDLIDVKSNNIKVDGDKIIIYNSVVEVPKTGIKASILTIISSILLMASSIILYFVVRNRKEN